MFDESKSSLSWCEFHTYFIINLFIYLLRHSMLVRRLKQPGKFLRWWVSNFLERTVVTRPVPGETLQQIKEIRSPVWRYYFYFDWWRPDEFQSKNKWTIMRLSRLLLAWWLNWWWRHLAKNILPPGNHTLHNVKISCLYLNNQDL